MGTSTSKPSPLSPLFERMATWDLKASRGLLQTYKDKDMDFGLDGQGLADLLGGDKDWADSIIDAFRSPTGIINALAFICGACLVSSGPALEKAGMIFDALDFDGTEQISMDEMTIALLCCARGFCVMAGVGSVPSDEELESVTLQAYRDLNKGSTQSITKTEFTKWMLEFTSGTGAPPTQEVTLQHALEQFRVVPPVVSVEEKKENNFADPVKKDDGQNSADLYDEVSHVEDVHTDDLPQQKEVEGTDVDAAELVVEQEPEFTEQAAVPIESTLVFTNVNENKLNDSEELYDGKEAASVETEPRDTAQIGGDDRGEIENIPTQTDEFKDQTGVPQTQEVESEQQNAYDSYDQPKETVNAESDNATFIADTDEAPQEPEPGVNDSHDRSASTDHGQRSEMHDEVTPQTGTTIDTDDQQDTPTVGYSHETPDVASEAMAVDELPLEPSATSDLGNDDPQYDQDEFAQETPENTERAAQFANAQIDFEPVTTESEGEIVNVQEIVESGDEAAETPAPIATPVQDHAEDELTLDRTGAGEEVLTDAPGGESTNLKAFDTYDYEQPHFDASSGLLHPEPQGLLDDSVAAAVDISPEEPSVE